MTPSIAILGAGAIGSYYGARLAQSGLPVHFLLRSDYDHVAAKGLSIRSIKGDFHLSPDQLHVYRSTHDMPKVDVVVVTLKTTANIVLPTLLLPLLHRQTTILTLQNGLGNEELLFENFGDHRILGGIAFTCIIRESPGRIDHQAHGHIHIGNHSVANGLTADDVASLFKDANIDTAVVPNLLQARWAKLIWNIPFNGLGALLDATTDQLISTSERTNEVKALMEEVRLASTSQNVHLPEDIADRNIALTRVMGSYMSSMQLDRRHRRPMEIDAILKRPLDLARQANLPTPRLAQLTTLLQLLDESIQHSP